MARCLQPQYGDCVGVRLFVFVCAHVCALEHIHCEDGNCPPPPPTLSFLLCRPLFCFVLYLCRRYETSGTTHTNQWCAGW